MIIKLEAVLVALLLKNYNPYILIVFMDAIMSIETGYQMADALE
jgi:hypothetical protein